MIFSKKGAEVNTQVNVQMGGSGESDESSRSDNQRKQPFLIFERRDVSKEEDLYGA